MASYQHVCGSDSPTSTPPILIKANALVGHGPKIQGVFCCWLWIKRRAQSVPNQSLILLLASSISSSSAAAIASPRSRVACW